MSWPNSTGCWRRTHKPCYLEKPRFFHVCLKMAVNSPGDLVSRHLREQNEGLNSRLTHPIFPGKVPLPCHTTWGMYLEAAELEELCLFFHKPRSQNVLSGVRWETPISSFLWYDRHHSLHRSHLRFHKIPPKTWVHLKLHQQPRVTTAEKQSPDIINNYNLLPSHSIQPNPKHLLPVPWTTSSVLGVESVRCVFPLPLPPMTPPDPSLVISCSDLTTPPYNGLLFSTCVENVRNSLLARPGLGDSGSETDVSFFCLYSVVSGSDSTWTVSSLLLGSMVHI